jgi:repressor LexA
VSQKPELSARQQSILDAIIEFQKENGYSPTLRELGDIVGLASVASVKYQVGELERSGYVTNNPNLSRSITVVSERERFENPDFAGMADITRIPLVGSIAAGVPITADQNIEEYFTLPKSLVGKNPELFMLKVKGNSMIEAAICDGDFVVCKLQQTAENGDIVAALLEDEATVKTFRQRDGHTWLLPQNSTMEPILGDHAVIMGKVVAVLRTV